MHYDELTNDTFTRRRITPPHVWMDSIFSDNEIDMIITHGEESELVEAEVVGGSG